MNLNKLTVKAREVLEQAGSRANSLNHQTVDVEHLLLSMLEQPEGLIRPILQTMEANISPVDGCVTSQA